MTSRVFVARVMEKSLQDRVERHRPLIEEICKVTGQVGLSYGVLHNGETVTGGAGYGDKQSQSPADGETIYNIASLTKAFTATACVMLANEELLDFNTPVQQYVPELHDAELTLTDILSHRSGYARIDTQWLGMNNQLLFDKPLFLAKVNNVPRARPLRSEWLYNNWMYALAGIIIDRKSRERSYRGFLERRIFNPLDMTRTSIRRALTSPNNVATSYAIRLDNIATPVGDQPYEESAFAAGGGIRSCTKDMLLWA